MGDARMLIPHTVKRQFAEAVVEGVYDDRGTMIDLSRTSFETMWKRLLPRKELHYPDDEFFEMVSVVLGAAWIQQLKFNLY
jgi:hypothetical protein